jgi:hypothetical protein
MAGGSLANIPAIADPDFFKDAVSMKPVDLPGNNKNQYALGDDQKGYIIFSESLNHIEINLIQKG